MAPVYPRSSLLQFVVMGWMASRLATMFFVIGQSCLLLKTLWRRSADQQTSRLTRRASGLFVFKLSVSPVNLLLEFGSSVSSGRVGVGLPANDPFEVADEVLSVSASATGAAADCDC